MRINISIILFILLYLFSGCRKDLPIPLQPYRPNDCPANGFDTMPKAKKGSIVLEPWIINDTPYVRFPYFNPSNADELIYYRADSKELIKYSISSKKKQLIYKGSLLNGAKWNKNGWILLAVGGQIWKIKDDATQLTQITHGPIAHYAPEWNLEGDKFICNAMNIGHGYDVIYDVNGNPIDSIENTGSFCWQNKDFIISPYGTEGIGIVDVQKDLFITLYSFPKNTTKVFGCYWMPDGINTVLVTSDGIYSFNTQTKKMTFLKQSCPNDLYSSFCISFISGKMLFEKDIWHYIGNNTILIKNKLVLMNSDGSGEIEVEL